MVTGAYYAITTHYGDVTPMVCREAVVMTMEIIVPPYNNSYSFNRYWRQAIPQTALMPGSF